MLRDARRYSTQRYMLLFGVLATLLTVAALGPRFSFSIGVEGNLLPALRDQAPRRSNLPLAPSALVVCGGALLWGGIGVLHMFRRVLIGALAVATEQQARVGTASFELAWAPAWGKKGALFVLSLAANLPIFAMMVYLAVRLQTALIFIAPLQVLRPLGDLSALFPPVLIGVSGVLWGTLGLWRAFAERALLLEDKPLPEAALHGGERLLRQLPVAVVGYALSSLLLIVFGGLFFVGGVYVVVCFLLWPSLLGLLSIAQTYISTLWTLFYLRGMPHGAH